MKCIEEILYNYKILETKIINIDIKLNMLHINEEESSKLQIKKATLIKEKNKIDEALTNLTLLENKIVKLRYFSRDKMPWNCIAAKLGYSTDYCKKRRRIILNKLTSILI